MKSLKNGSGKIFARLRTRRATAAFSAVLLAKAMLTAAIFFASCGNPEYDIATPPPPRI
jgi:hypothetical protein